jgi:hypothetical protein
MISRELGVAVVLALVATSATAQQVEVSPPQQTVSTYCATLVPGNPFSPVYDYQSYVAFKAGGGWDSRGNDACARNPMYSPGGTSPSKLNPFPNNGWSWF